MSILSEEDALQTEQHTQDTKQIHLNYTLAYSTNITNPLILPTWNILYIENLDLLYGVYLTPKSNRYKSNRTQSSRR